MIVRRQDIWEWDSPYYYRNMLSHTVLTIPSASKDMDAYLRWLDWYQYDARNRVKMIYFTFPIRGRNAAKA